MGAIHNLRALVSWSLTLRSLGDKRPLAQRYLVTAIGPAAAAANVAALITSSARQETSVVVASITPPRLGTVPLALNHFLASPAPPAPARLV